MKTKLLFAVALVCAAIAAGILTGPGDDRDALLPSLPIRLEVEPTVDAAVDAPLDPSEDRTSPGIITPEQTQRALARRLAELEPESPEARRLRGLVSKVRRKAHQRREGGEQRRLTHGAPAEHPLAENPGAFWEALAQLKTTADGKTYPPNYKIAQLEQAKRSPRKISAPLPWVERGPGNVAGRARAIVVDPDDPSHDTWFVASIGGGIWKTEDGGNTFVDKTPQMMTLSTTCLAMCASQPDVMYAGTGMGYGRIVDLEGSGVWKTEDRGETWFQLASTANGELLDAVNRIVVDPGDPDIVVLCSNDAFSHLGTKGGTRISRIYRSTDGGDSWTEVFDPGPVFGPLPDKRIQQVVAHPTDFNILYATVNEVGVVKSTDGGITWGVSADDFALPSDIGNPTGGGFGLAGISVRTEMAIAPSNPNRLYAAVERPRGVADLYMSTDAGNTWVLVNDTSGDPNWFNAFGLSGVGGNYTAGWFDNAIAVHPWDPDVVFVGGVNLYRIDVDAVNHTRATTAIGWWTFNDQGIPFAHADHHWLEIVPVTESLGQFWILDANDGGVAVSRNGGVNWTQLTGMGTTQFYGADKMPGQSAYIGGMQDNGTWRSGVDPGPGSNWQFDIGGDGFEVVWNYRDPDLLLGCYQFGGILRSTDAGNTWTVITDLDLGNAPFITKIANSKTDPDLVFSIGTNGVARSDDFGATWTMAPVFWRWLGWRPFSNVEVHDADPQVVWIASRLTTDPTSGIRGGIHVSRDGGFTFREISDSLPPQMTEASGLGVHPSDPASAYLLFSAPGTPKILRTEDYGDSWEDISGFSVPAKAPGASPTGFPDVATFSLLQMPYDESILWAGTEIGLFTSEDAGATWSFADNGLPHVAVFEMKIVDDQIVVATQGRGVWSVTMPELAGHVPPVVTLAPRLSGLAQQPSGYVAINVDLRSPYDETTVWLNGSLLQSLGPNSEPMVVTIPHPVTQIETIAVSVVSTKDGREYRAGEHSLTVFPGIARNRFATDFSSPAWADDFAQNGFAVRLVTGFNNGAAHSGHPYPTNTDLTFMLRHPIRVDDTDSILRYRDVCIVEEGVDPNYTDPNFWDYVIVEGTKDGIEWRPLLPGYDSRANAAWLAAYRAGSRGTGDMYVDHVVDLRQTFEAGDLIFIRFRLFSDSGVTAWGWAIDDLVIQDTALGLPPGEEPEPTGDLPSRVALEQNFPNPFNPVTTVRYALPEPGRVRLRVYDVAGRRVRELLNANEHPAGTFTVEWNGRDEAGAAVSAGTYLYELEAGGRIETRKMILVK